MWGLGMDLTKRKDHTDHQDQPWSKIRSTAWSKRLYGAPKKTPVILFLDISAYFRITLVFIEGISDKNWQNDRNHRKREKYTL